jgi:hypothetical protein
MKTKSKILLVSLFLFLSATINKINAQLPAGSYAPDFTVTDQFGVSHNLYNYLNAGYTVFMEVSATWTGPSWSYFLSNALNDLYTNHGPAGAPGVSATTSDDVMVIWIEGDPSTSDASMLDGQGSIGNWLNPTGSAPIQFPMANPNAAWTNSINNDYAIAYFPTVYRICPSRAVNEVGQWSATELYNTVTVCPPEASQPYDPSIFDYIGPESVCSETPVNIVLQNYGTQPLTSCSFIVNGGTNTLNYNWSGNLLTYQIDTVFLGNVSIAADAQLTVTMTSPDSNNSNNTINHDVLLGPSSSTVLKLDILFDNYPEQCSWDIKDEFGTVVASQQYSTANAAASNVIEYVSLPTLGCYTFTAYDFYGDGFAGGGAFNSHIIITSLTNANTVYSTIWNYNGSSYYSQRDIAFNVVSATGELDGCADPLACNYDPLANINLNCVFPGCTDINACNYNPFAGCNDNSCTYDCGACSELFISEVVEGTSNNKAVEIYNPTNSTIDLSGYGLAGFANGSSSMGAISFFDGYSIAPHDVIVIVIDKQNPLGTGIEAPVWPDLQAVADVFINPIYDFSLPMYFTGNDAIALVKDQGNILVDLYGRIGEGSGFLGWSSYGTSPTGSTLYASRDHSQIRKNGVNIGVSANPDSFDVFVEYDTLAVNTFDHLGWHECDCNNIAAGCINPSACNYNPLDQNTASCVFPGCTNISACNYNANAGCDDGSCVLINSPCNDNNPNTYNDVYTSSCNCSGSAFSYGNLDNNTVALCSGENTQIAMIYEPVGLPSYSLQWYYKSGVVNAPFGVSTAGWMAIPGATTSVVDVNSFVGSRTYACFVTTDGSMGLMSQWANGVSYINYSSINAQAIIGNPNITPFNNYTYAVTSVLGNTYNWTVTNGAVVSGQGTSVVSILWGQNGPYQVTLSESDGTCSGTSVLFAVNNNCTISVSAASATSTSFCSGASVQLQAATNATNITYQWYLNGVAIAGETNQNTAATLGGNYQVSITQNGCSAISQILAITELPGITMPTLVVDQANAGCSGSDATVSLTDANYSTITWSNGTVNTSSINVSESGSYSVTVSDNNGCTATSSAVDVNLSLVSVVPICLVTVDQATGKNNVVWEPVTSGMINSYVILKETNVANVYAQIGTVAYGSNGLFEDVNSNPQVQANRYKLALIDTCGILSSNSDFHKTIHLATNQGLGNNVNLIWSGYEGFDFGSYNIYRGASAANMTLLTTIASNLDSYTDINPPAGDVYYMIEVEGVSCDPQRTLVYSHSNVITTTTDGVEELSNAISLYPNPATTSINLQVNTSLLGQEYIVFDAIGKVIYKNKIQSTNAIIQIENFNNGNYFVKVNEVVKRFVVQH